MKESFIVPCLVDPRKDCSTDCSLYQNAQDVAFSHPGDPKENLDNLRSVMSVDPQVEDFITVRIHMFVEDGRFSQCEKNADIFRG